MGNDTKCSPLWDDSLSVDEKLDLLVKELTLDEKLHMLASGSGGIERLNIPDCRLGGEAAHGVEARNDQFRVSEPDLTTSFPEPVGMSSSWDREAVKAAGTVVGREARAIYNKKPGGGLSRWAPTVDLLRDPRWGRNEEAYGEDPLQVGAMASAYVQGIQGDKDRLTAASTLKHFYANNTEIGRGWKNSSISPRNKFELYLEPFRRCIEDGGAEGIMTAYNRINGVQGLFCEDVKHILKDEFGLSHAVSDGGAMELTAAFSHATAMDAETLARSLKAGVDAMSGWPEGVYKAALEAWELGLITEEDLDEAIRNTYRTRIRLGVFAKEPFKTAEPCDSEAREICKKLTDASLVLLKNEGILPLKQDALKDTVLIGPLGNEWFQDWYGGAAPEHVTLLDGLKEAGAPDNIRFVDGLDRITLKCGDKYLAAGKDEQVGLSDKPDVFILTDWGEGSWTLKSEHTGKYLITKLAEDAIIGIAAAEGPATGNRISGKVYADSDRIFNWFDLEVFRLCEEGDGVILKDRFGNRIYADNQGNLVSAKEDYEGLKSLCFTLETVSSGIEEAVKAAAGAGTVILALGHNPMVNAKEEVDRETIAFIPYQQRLFDEVSKANPNTAVVLFSDYPFAINELKERAKAILWSATGSQCMGRSVADALMGKVHPAGRLAQTWYKGDKDLPSIDDYDIIGKGRTYRYFEGDVLYPFGYGLSYTTFKYDGLKVTVEEGAPTAKEPSVRKYVGQPTGVYDEIRQDGRVLKVELSLTNTGSCASDEVVQVYAKVPEGRIKRPLKQLIGFERVRDVAPGETRRIELTIPVRELAFYDVISEKLVIEGGTYGFFAGSSSSDEAVTANLDLKGYTPGLRDMSRKIKADHYDEAKDVQIVEGLYGFNAIMSEGINAYEPKADGGFTATYGACDISEDSKLLRLHAYAPDDAEITVFIDDTQVGKVTTNTRDYEKHPSEARNRMPRARVDEAGRKGSWPLLWADVMVPLDLSKLQAAADGSGRTIRIETVGPVKYDWFTILA